MQDLSWLSPGSAKAPAERLPKHPRQLVAESIQTVCDVAAKPKKAGDAAFDRQFRKLTSVGDFAGPAADVASMCDD